MAKIDKENPLYSLIEHTEELLDTNERLSRDVEAIKAENRSEISSVKAALDEEKRELEELKERLRALDRLLPKGGKVYLPADGSPAMGYDPAADELARFIIDVAAYRLDGRPRFNCETFKNAQKEGTDSLGGYLVPPETAPVIINKRDSYGLARQLCTVLPMKRDEMTVPTESAGMTVYWPGESTAPSDSGITFAGPKITAKRMIATNKISIELDEDSVPYIRDYLIDRVAVFVAKEEDKQAFRGSTSGGDPFDGILYASGVTSVVMGSGKTSFTDLTYDDLLSLLSATDEFAAERGVYVSSAYIMNLIRGLKDTTGRPLIDIAMLLGTPTLPDDVISQKRPLYLLSRPYYLSPVMPKASDDGASEPFLIYGDLKLFAIGDRSRISIEFSREYDFAAGNITMRVMERVGFALLDGTGIAKLVTAAS